MPEPHLAQDVVVLVEGGGVDAERDAAAAPQRLADRRDPRAQMEVGAGVGRDDRAGAGDRVEFVGARVDAMRQRQPRREQAEHFEARDDALGIGGVREGALIAGLQQVHVNAPAGALEASAIARKQFVRAPLRAVGAELHGESRALDRRRDRLDASDLLGRARQRRKESRLDGGAPHRSSAPSTASEGP